MIYRSLYLIEDILERYGGFTKHHDPTLWKLMQMSRMGLDEDTHRTLFWAVYGNKPVDDPIWYKVLKKLPTAESLPNHGKQHSAVPAHSPPAPASTFGRTEQATKPFRPKCRTAERKNRVRRTHTSRTTLKTRPSDFSKFPQILFSLLEKPFKDT